MDVGRERLAPAGSPTIPKIALVLFAKVEYENHYQFQLKPCCVPVFRSVCLSAADEQALVEFLRSL
jgi:hypothetical protein